MSEDHKINEPNFEGEEMKMPTEVATAPAAENKNILNGPIILLLFIILVAILGGLYYWYSIVKSTPIIQPTNNRPTAEQNNEPESINAEAQTQALDVVSTSDELDTIEADVSSTNLDNLDAELNALDAELTGALDASNI